MKPALLLPAFLASLSLYGQRPIDTLIKAEQHFAGAAAKDGLKAAFLAALSDESLVYRGTRFVPGKAFYEKVPDTSPFLLSWKPAYAEISAAGDLGFTTGPFDIRNPAGGEPTGYGHFVSIWQKEADGTWKNRMDLGISHPRPTEDEHLTTYQPETVPGTLAELEEAERRFVATAQNDLAGALTAVFTDHSRLLVDGALPYSGSAAQAYARTISGGRPYETLRTVLSLSGDLGYSYGYSPSEKGGYLRVWRRLRDGWKLALQVTAPGQ